MFLLDLSAQLRFANSGMSTASKLSAVPTGHSALSSKVESTYKLLNKALVEKIGILYKKRSEALPMLIDSVLVLGRGLSISKELLDDFDRYVKHVCADWTEEELKPVPESGQSLKIRLECVRGVHYRACKMLAFNDVAEADVAMLDAALGAPGRFKGEFCKPQAPILEMEQYERIMSWLAGLNAPSAASLDASFASGSVVSILTEATREQTEISRQQLSLHLNRHSVQGRFRAAPSDSALLRSMNGVTDSSQRMLQRMWVACEA